MLKRMIDPAREQLTNLDIKDNSQICASVINDLDKLNGQIEYLQQTIVSSLYEELEEMLLLDYASLKEKVRQVRLSGILKSSETSCC